MLKFYVFYDPNHHPDGRNWILAGKTKSGLVFEQRTNSPAKPTGKMLRTYKHSLAKRISYYTN